MFGEKVRQLRKSKGLTMKELGSRLNLSESTISGYELGTRKPDIETLRELAHFFDVSTDFLLGLTDVQRDAGTAEAEAEEDIDVSRVALHMEGQYGPMDPYTLDVIQRVIRDTVREYRKQEGREKANKGTRGNQEEE